MNKQSVSELRTELCAIRQKLAELEARQDDSKLTSKSVPRRSITRRGWGWLPLAAGIVLVTGAVFAAGEALFINPNGNVGIGTNDPKAPLHVEGNAVFSKWIGVGNTDPQASLDVNGDAVINGGATIKGNTVMSGNLGIGVDSPKANVDVQQADRTGAHPASVKGLYVTGDFAADSGVEFRHSNGTQGIGFGYNTIYATGGNALQDLNLKPRGAGKVIVTGSLQVNGPLQHQGVYQKNDEPANTRKISPRYHLTLTAPTYHGKSKMVPQATLVELCGDEDGCQVRLGMTKWDNDIKTETASRSFLFYYSSQNGRWRASSGVANWDSVGVDGDQKTQHVAKPWTMCHFTDGSYSGMKNLGDKQKGMELLMWKGDKGQYQGPNRTCELTLID